jgi:hypothetical protein
MLPSVLKDWAPTLGDNTSKETLPEIETSACAAVALIATRAVVARRTLRMFKSPLENVLPLLATSLKYNPSPK